MARPSYPGVLYFPLDCRLDDNIDLIQAEYGLTGFAVVVKLFQKIYGELGYYCEWNRDVGLLFAQKNGVGYNFVSEVVGACLRRGIFCEALFDQYGILTSRGIQKRYLKMVERRIGEKISPGYALVECAKKKDMSTETPDNVNENSENADSENVEKEKKIKEYYSLSQTRAHARGTHHNVILTEEEYSDICEQIAFADAYIDYFSEKLFKKGYQYENHHDSILEWWKTDGARFERKQTISKRTDHQKSSDKSDRELCSSFETDDFFQAALARSVGDCEQKNEGDNEKHP